MKLQFINNISLDVISGGNIYNKALIDGLSQNDFVVGYNSSPLNQDYDITIVDSLCMNDIDLNKLNKNKPIIALIHQLPELQTHALSFYKTYAKFVVTGEPTKQELIDVWQVNEHDITIIRPGISENWKPKTVFSDTAERIIIVSNFIRNKGFEMLIQVLKRLNHLDLIFDIIGNNELDKAYAEDIIASIQKTNANVTFHFNLNRDDLYNQLMKADIFLSLSESESFGMAIFEALTIGLPCLAYKTGDCNCFSTYPNYVGLVDYSEANFSEIIEEWSNNSIPYKAHCDTKSNNKRRWKQVLDEFSMYLKNTVAC